MRIERMTQEQAAAYINWTYGSPYDFYNIPSESHNETMQDILSDNGMDYYSVLDESGSLYGMFEFSFPDGIMMIGLGIRPEQCGKGNGREFVKKCIAFGRKKYSYLGKIRLMVVDFNSRAIHLYHSLGFVEVEREKRLSYGTSVTFLILESAEIA